MAHLSLQLADNACRWEESNRQILILKSTFKAIFVQKIADKPNVNMQKKTNPMYLQKNGLQNISYMTENMAWRD